MAIMVMVFVLLVHVWRSEHHVPALEAAGTAEIGSDGITARVWSNCLVKLTKIIITANEK